MMPGLLLGVGLLDEAALDAAPLGAVLDLYLLSPHVLLDDLGLLHHVLADAELLLAPLHPNLALGRGVASCRAQSPSLVAALAQPAGGGGARGRADVAGAGGRARLA